MDTSIEPLEGNKVKLFIAISEQEFEPAITAAFRKLAHEVRIPGFRPGKAPRRLLEARFGAEVAREQALKDGLSQFYSDALTAESIDVIAPPQIEITEGEESGPVAFEAVVELYEEQGRSPPQSITLPSNGEMVWSEVLVTG